MVKIVMVIATMMLATMLTKMEVGKKVVNKLLVGGRVFVMPIISLMNISMVLILGLKQAVPVCAMPLALIQTVVDQYFPDFISYIFDVSKIQRYTVS